MVAWAAPSLQMQPEELMVASPWPHHKTASSTVLSVLDRLVRTRECHRMCVVGGAPPERLLPEVVVKVAAHPHDRQGQIRSTDALGRRDQVR